MFSEYSSTPFAIEPVNVVYPAGQSHPTLAGQTVTTPDLSQRTVTADVGFIQRAIGVGPDVLPAESIPPLLQKMMLGAELVDGGKSVEVKHPPSRASIVMPSARSMPELSLDYE
jgi:phenylalanyl-tRNA synthetase beta chain